MVMKRTVMKLVQPILMKKKMTDSDDFDDNYGKDEL